jgi:hypothetical protein
MPLSTLEQRANEGRPDLEHILHLPAGEVLAEDLGSSVRMVGAELRQVVATAGEVLMKHLGGGLCRPGRIGRPRGLRAIGKTSQKRVPVPIGLRVLPESQLS